MTTNPHQIEIRLVNEDGVQSRQVTPTLTSGVRASALKAELLAAFGRGSSLYELEAESDENESWVLRGVDTLGTSHEIDGDQELDLHDYTSFVATPRVALG